jgi:branched-chain amino acid transport system ATP-binding protein
MGAMNALLSTHGLSKHFGGILATNQIDLAVEAGETHAIIGPNGAGKTTLIAQLAGALASDRGRIVFDGADITALASHQRVARGLARSYQVTSLFPNFTAEENILFAGQARTGSSFSFWRSRTRESALREAARTALQEVGLEALASQRAAGLAHGQQRQLELALALATGPKLLLLDEPMAGMGPEESREMFALLQRLKSRLTLVLVEHDMDTVFRLADRISVLVAGQIIATGTPESIRRNADVRAAYLGEEHGEP